MPVYIIRAKLGMFHTNTPIEPPAATLTATARPTAATVTGTTNLSCSRRRALTLAVAPCRELHAARLPDSHQVVALPPDQGDLLGGGGHAAAVRGARQCFDLFEAIVEWSQVPARALRADHPEATFPLIEREPPSDAEPRRAAVAVELAVAEGAGSVHQLPVLKRSMLKGAMSTSEIPLVRRSAVISPVSAASRMPLRPCPVAYHNRSTSGSRPRMGCPSGVAGRSPAHMRCTGCIMRAGLRPAKIGRAHV